MIEDENVFKAMVLSRLEDLERDAAIQKLNIEALRKDSMIAQQVLSQICKQTNAMLARFN